MTLTNTRIKCLGFRLQNSFFFFRYKIWVITHPNMMHFNFHAVFITNKKITIEIFKLHAIFVSAGEIHSYMHTVFGSLIWLWLFPPTVLEELSFLKMDIFKIYANNAVENERSGIVSVFYSTFYLRIKIGVCHLC